ncbi:MAG: hypothetical protein RSH52_17855 [Janthinobacterium sp.]
MTHGATLFANDAGGYVYVKSGFSWPALLLGSFWAVAKRRWWLLLLMLAMDVCLWFGSQLASGLQIGPMVLLMGAAELSYLLARGWYGNRWLEASLRSHGYKPVVPGTDASP